MRLGKDLILLAILYSALLGLALFVPIWATIPAGLAITALFIVRRLTDHRKKVENIHQRLSNLRSEGLIVEGKVKGTEDDVFYRMILTLLTDLERSLFKLVEKNIQLLSLKEIGRNIISSLDEKRLIDSVFDYLVRGVGYKEVAFILLRKSKASFQAIVSIERSTRIIRRTLNFGFEDLQGSIHNSLMSGKPFLIKDVAMHPLIEVGGEPMFTGSTMSSYLIVPLMKSSEEVLCHTAEECLLRKLSGNTSDPDVHHYLESDRCLSCPDIPLLGAIIVTDGFRATPLTNIDQVTIETVGSLVSSNIENWLLYQELRQEEIFRDKVLEGMIHGIVVIDLGGKVTLINRSARTMGLYPREGDIGVSVGDLIIAESSESEHSPVMNVIKNNISRTAVEAYLRRSDGIHIPIRMNVSPLIGDDGEIQGAIVMFVDISETIRMEEEIRHLDRLAVLGRFTSAVAHEIRNPLTGIAAGIQYLDRDESLSDDQRENLSFILNEVDRLNRIITDLFKVAKPRQLLYQRINLADLVERSYKSLDDIIRNKRIDFRMDIDHNLPLIEVDPDQITQVMINILKNSLEAVEEEGRVSIRANIYEGGDREVILEKDRDMICIELEDDGPGIEPSDKEKLFEPFFTRKKGGTGLGLFITHSIVQHHQGRITVKSEPQGGTIFRIYLPMTRLRKGGHIETGRPSR
jgi:PAS domain S-box-containing protein